MATPTLSQSAKLYQERKLPADRNTRRGPGPRHSFDLNAVHTLPLHPPLPWPDACLMAGQQPPLAAGLSQPWPYGTEEIT